MYNAIGPYFLKKSLRRLPMIHWIVIIRSISVTNKDDLGYLLSIDSITKLDVSTFPSRMVSLNSDSRKVISVNGVLLILLISSYHNVAFFNTVKSLHQNSYGHICKCYITGRPRWALYFLSSCKVTFSYVKWPYRTGCRIRKHTSAVQTRYAFEFRTL